MNARTSIVSVVILAFAATVAAQQAPTRDRTAAPPTVGTAILSGTVVNDATGRPLRRASVSIFAAEIGLRLAAVTGDDGTFGFTDLPAGRYSLNGSKIGYVGASYGARKVDRPGVAINLLDGDKRTDVTLRLPPGAVVTGTVRTANGEPMPGARVTLLRRSVRYDTGESTLVRANTGVGGLALSDQTDDRGVYRWYGVAPDDYYVVVAPGGPLIRDANELREITPAEFDWAARILREPNGAPIVTPPPAPGPAVVYAPVFYPGVPTTAQASLVSVKVGEERDGVDVVVDLVPTVKLTGTISVPGGGTLPPLAVNVVAHDAIPGLPFSGFGNARVDREGRFSGGGVVPGDYTVMVRPSIVPSDTGGSPSALALFGLATVTVTVNGGDVDVPITLESGVTVSGRVTFDGTSPPAALAGIQVNLVSKPKSTPMFGVPTAMTDASGAFSFAGVTPGSYHLAASGVGAWRPRSASGGGQEALDGFINVGHADITDAKVTFTDRPTEVNGSLVDAAGKPAPEYTIIIFAADKTFWTPLSRRIQSTKPASDGHFRVANLPAGDYRIAAVTDVEQGEWYDPAFLTEITGASRPFTLADGEKKVEDIKIVGGGLPQARR